MIVKFFGADLVIGDVFVLPLVIGNILVSSDLESRFVFVTCYFFLPMSITS